MATTHEESCLCGAVRYRAKGPLSEVTACHCSQCRKQSGHHLAATNVPDERLQVEGEDKITWYRASSEAKRGFCTICGSTLFWKHDNEDFTWMLAGSLDGGTRLTIAKHIFCADKGDYYDIPAEAPQSP